MDNDFDAKKARANTFGSTKFTEILQQIQQASLDGYAEIQLDHKLFGPYKTELEKRGFTIIPKKIMLGYPTKTTIKWG